ncbi:MAG TPA: T9SS type A sorting domain-containing protein [Chitinophagaceae bacterium]|nr:T9SS type A sorting domain-containing protein [Chitinophagaceae bacterium]
MRINLLSFLFLLATLCFTIIIQAQHDRFVYAITDLQQAGSGWNALRKLDLKSGEYSPVLLNGTDATVPIYDATTRNAFKVAPDLRYGNIMQTPFNTGVAAMAYDKKNNRIYFTPMFIDQLRYIDLKTMKVFYINDQPFTGFGNMHNEEGKIISRMVIAPDGMGYAITNDGSSLIKFTTGKKIQITQLGSLADDPANDAVSIHNRCSSWGGDIVADNEGNLYIFSNRNSVYKINTVTKVAKLLGYIKGLPEGFTTNGAVVTNEGKILVSSAVNDKAYFIVDSKSWTASEYKYAPFVFRSSDLANSNYLQTKPGTSVPEFVTRRAPETMMAEKIMIYPNPVTHDQFTLQFGKITTGNYNIELTDVMGRLIMQKGVNVAAEDQVETISLKSATARGVYLIKVSDKNGKSVISQKLVVQ